MADNTLTLKFDETSAMALVEKIGGKIILPIVEGAGKSAYAIAVAHGFKGTESEWLESLRGPQGDKGDKGSAEETAQILKKDGEFLKSLKGPKGDAGSAEKSAQILKENGIWLENASVDTVLMKVIELSQCCNNFVPKSLNFVQPKAGATYIDFTGEPHYKIAINDGDKREFQSDNMRVAIDDSMKGNIKVDYYNLTDNIIGTYTINLVVENEAYDWGSLVETKEISEGGAKATLQKYENGAKINVTKFDNSVFELEINNVYSKMINNNGLRNIKTIELDLTKLPIISTKGYWNSSGDILRVFNNQDYVMLKVKKEQTVTPSILPGSPSSYGTAEYLNSGTNVKTTDVKLQINDSNVVTIGNMGRARYSFATNRIEKIG